MKSERVIKFYTNYLYTNFLCRENLCLSQIYEFRCRVCCNSPHCTNDSNNSNNKASAALSLLLLNASYQELHWKCTATTAVDNNNNNNNKRTTLEYCKNNK